MKQDQCAKIDEEKKWLFCEDFIPGGKCHCGHKPNICDVTGEKISDMTKCPQDFNVIYLEAEEVFGKIYGDEALIKFYKEIDGNEEAFYWNVHHPRKIVRQNDIMDILNQCYEKEQCMFFDIDMFKNKLKESGYSISPLFPKFDIEI